MISLWLSKKLFLHGIEKNIICRHPKGLQQSSRPHVDGILVSRDWLIKTQICSLKLSISMKNADFTWLWLMDQQQTSCFSYIWRGWENPIYVLSNLTWRAPKMQDEIMNVNLRTICVSKKRSSGIETSCQVGHKHDICLGFLFGETQDNSN